MATHHTIVVSDLHLWQGLPDDEHTLWMRYRQRRFFPDADLASMLDAALAAIAPADRLEVVLNGDILDLDVAPTTRESHLRFGPPYPDDERGAYERVHAILAEHPSFIASLGRVLAAGHRVVYVAGNHDAAMAVFEACQTEWKRVLLLAARHALGDGPWPRGETLASLTERIVVRSWFHRTRDGVHVEHGNQYDPHNSFLVPGDALVGSDRDTVAPPCGSLVVRELIGRLGYMNPEHDASFTLGPWRLLSHWARYYALSPRHWLVFTWLRGVVAAVRDRRAQCRIEQRLSLQTRFELIQRASARAANESGALHADAREQGCYLYDPQLNALSLAHELGAFRVGAITLLISLWILLLASGEWRAIATSAMALVLSRLLMRRLYGVKRNTLALARELIQSAQRVVLRLRKDTRAIVFGHTHEPFGERLSDGKFSGNCGTWAPRFEDIECTRAVDGGLRPLVWLRTRDGVSPDQPIDGGLRWFDPRTRMFSGGEALIARSKTPYREEAC